MKQCPKCGSEMIKIKENSIEIDQCCYCKGNWFDKDELETILTYDYNVNKIDTGNSSTGEENDKKTKLAKCPICKKSMLKVTNLKEPYLFYEKCIEHGIYLDAGELKKLKIKSLEELFENYKFIKDKEEVLNIIKKII